jgi:hypothetical protein
MASEIVDVTDVDDLRDRVVRLAFETGEYAISTSLPCSGSRRPASARGCLGLALGL